MADYRAEAEKLAQSVLMASQLPQHLKPGAFSQSVDAIAAALLALQAKAAGRLQADEDALYYHARWKAAEERAEALQGIKAAWEERAKSSLKLADQEHARAEAAEAQAARQASEFDRLKGALRDCLRTLEEAWGIESDRRQSIRLAEAALKPEGEP